MKILIIEDDPSLQEIIKKSLEKERYVVETADNYQAALLKLDDYDYDCILLDIMLPGGSGLQILESLKREKRKENVIIISAKDSLEDKVAGLDLGADDYLAKPFHLAELNARIKSVIRQSGDTADTPGCTLTGPLGSIDIDHGVIVAKRHIHMTPFQALQMRVKDKDEVFVIMESFERSLIFADVVVRVDPNFALAMHVDTDEANAFANSDHPTGVILKLFGGRTYNLQKWAEELQSGIRRI